MVVSSDIRAINTYDFLLFWSMSEGWGFMFLNKIRQVCISATTTLDLKVATLNYLSTPYGFYVNNNMN